MPNEDLKTKLKQIIDPVGSALDSHGQKIDEIGKAIDKKLDTIKEEIVNEVVSQFPEVKDGEDGYTPIKGVDYFDGEPGKDGESIIGSPGKDGKDGENGKSIEGPPGKDGTSGKDGINPNPKEVIEEIKVLKGKEAIEFGNAVGPMIDISKVKNADTFIFNKNKYKIEELMRGGGGGGSDLEIDEDGIKIDEKVKKINFIGGFTITDISAGSVTVRPKPLITVSHTAPSVPQLYDLWLEIP